MVNWRELGEVPDSEDEDDIDSQDTVGVVTSTAQLNEVSITGEEGPEARDIWDIPSTQEQEAVVVVPAIKSTSTRQTSPPPQLRQSQSDLASSPLSTPRSSLESPSSIGSILHKRTPEDARISQVGTPVRDNEGGRFQSGSRSPRPSHIDDVIPSQYDAATFDSTLKTPLPSQVLGHDEDFQQARQVAVRYERSLRARRPEQMRPYFTEQARFNNSWRKHGLRPVRFANAEDRSQRPGPENRNEQDFEPASQESNQQQVTDDSQGLVSSQIENALQITTLSSSPLETSPCNNRGGQSSQLGSQGETDSTSVDGDDLPSLHDLARKHYKKKSGLMGKRTLSPMKSATRKRQKSSHGLQPETPTGGEQLGFIRPPDSSDPFAMDPELTGRTASPEILSDHGNAGGHSLSDSSPEDTVSAIEAAELTVNNNELVQRNEVSPVVQGDELDATVSESNFGDGPESESESEVVNENSRRIRGVLPASWLRLDQQTGRNNIQRKVQSRQGLRSPLKEPRRGVALRRYATQSAVLDGIFSENSEDDTQEIPKPNEAEVHSQRRLVLEPSRTLEQLTEALPPDHDASDMEEDHIDHMGPGRKRQTTISGTFQTPSKRPKVAPSTSKTPASKTYRQTKITSASTSSQKRLVKRQRDQKIHVKQRQPSKPKNKARDKDRTYRAHGARPPSLSILDVITPEAPRFLKIAARTARAAPNQGRASPTKKVIQLAHRQDHLDAVSVLRDWKQGSIKQRLTVTATKPVPPPRACPAPLADKPSNSLRVANHKALTSRQAPRKITREISAGGRISYSTQRSAEDAPCTRPSLLGSKTARPAQLEMESSHAGNAARFQAGKKFLDRLYQSKRGSSASNGSVQSRSVAGTIRYPPTLPSVPDMRGVRTPKEIPVRPTRTRRKTHKPQRLNLDEPQYSHASDPLPTDQQLTVHGAHSTSQGQAEKLLGLGAYGARYTVHFEIFPLHPSVYFHETTMLGSGQLDAIPDDYASILQSTRPRAKLILGEQTMLWGPWDAQVSSEMGVVLDYTVDALEAKQPPEEPTSPSATVAAGHLLSYVRDSITFNSEDDAKVFVTRVLELLQGFDARVAASIDSGSLNQNLDSALSTYDQVLLFSFVSLKICLSFPAMIQEHMQFEAALTSMAAIMAKGLGRAGLQKVRCVYVDLLNTGLREKGLRKDAQIIHSWVLLYRILEKLRIPRASFWDVVHRSIIPSDVVTSTVQVKELEGAWENMFTLLPLTEFDDNGVINSGWRHRASTDGWSIVQKLLKRVFQLYQANTRQSPSFNDYCRALIGRCHYLVQQWGWRRCSSVVGMVFDFFGTQQLAHLRNEEAYGSPRFLEELSRTPSLDLQSEDRCFHIFLKLIALSIHKLREYGLTKDIRNLIARTLPNHARQHLKEQTIHERDLAALRNHHDLLCTLFWAAPPDLRPSINLIERLVAPATSHKEACLINLRAWSQLAQFVIAKGEAAVSFAPFNIWRNNFFQQMMHQYDTVAVDIEQQFQGLSRDVSQSVSPDMVKAMIASNKAAVVDVVHSCLTSSLDVMRCAPDLEASTFALSTSQLQQVFKHFFSDPPEFGWSLLRTCLSTLDAFLKRVDEFKEAEESQQSESQILNSAQADDALLVLDHELAGSYFTMARRVLSHNPARGLSPVDVADRAECVQLIVILGAKLGLRFINAGVTDLSAMFRSGKHGIFRDSPQALELDQRRYLPLFIATLLQYGFDNFDKGDGDLSLLKMWMISIVKPRSSLMYENRLAEQLLNHGASFVPRTMAGLAIAPDYGVNRDLFQHAISWMRQCIRDAGPELRKVLLPEHTRALKLVMDKMKDDLKVVSMDADQHPSYVSFVRDIISLIRTHGADICAVDEYFYQISKEYSPSMQDPQLQVAGMVSYGVRLAEGDSRVVHQLFFFLFNNFKLGLIGDKLEEEMSMLERGFRNPWILEFVLGKMLPAIIGASVVEPSALVLLDIYAFAIDSYLAGDDALPVEIPDSSLGALRLTLEAIIEGLGQLNMRTACGETLHLARQLVGLLNVFWPSLQVLSMSDAPREEWEEVMSLLKRFRHFAAEIDTADPTLREEMWRESDVMTSLRSSSAKAISQDAHIASFTENIVSDVRQNWIMTGDRLSIQAPSKMRNTQSTQSNQQERQQGVSRPRRASVEELLADFEGRIQEWNGWWERVFESWKWPERFHGTVVLGF